MVTTEPKTFYPECGHMHRPPDAEKCRARRDRRIVRVCVDRGGPCGSDRRFFERLVVPARERARREERRIRAQLEHEASMLRFVGWDANGSPTSEWTPPAPRPREPLGLTPMGRMPRGAGAVLLLSAIVAVAENLADRARRAEEDGVWKDHTKEVER